MRAGWFALFVLLLTLPASAQTPPSTSMDVAPTMLALKPGEAGLFYVTNHGAAPIAVEIAPMDWRQAEGRDVLTPSTSLFVSPPVVTIAPGARQSVRLMATQAKGAWRLLISELPDPSADAANVRVLLQFSVPVFVGLGDTPPALAWEARRNGDALDLGVTNRGAMPVKLSAARLGGAKLAEGPIYVLPGSRRSFAVRGADSLRVTAQDSLSGRALLADADMLP